MGRKRLEKKKRKVMISVDPDVYDFLKRHEINRSVIFDNAAKQLIKEYETKYTNENSEKKD